MRRPSLLLCAMLAFSLSAPAADWLALGPDGGDARVLTYDPQNPDHIVLGTMAGKLFSSTDGGAHWTRLARLGGDDYVLDRVAFDPADSNRIYVAGWSVTDDAGAFFRSSDGGKTWAVPGGVRGKSIRAMVLAPSNPKEIVVGAIDGVYRSLDGGDSWSQISPPHHAEIKNVQSLAIDPKDPDVIYAGTWHLPWKTRDGGRTWNSMKKGIIDDSDVFSIIIDPRNPSVVYVSACSGIYQSEDAGELFHKIQGMPFSARRTRDLRMDPADSSIVYAGTTEGLWKTLNAGKTFSRVTAPGVVVNSILVDPRKSQRVLLATDRGGVLVSDDGAATFASSNSGFSHRQVASLLVDRNDGNTLYAGIINDKEFGGIFVSRDAGQHWQQMSSGLEGRDIFSLRQTPSGTLVAGTNRGAFAWKAESYHWMPINTVLTEKEVAVKAASRRSATTRKITERSELGTRVNDLSVEGPVWYAATPLGLFSSSNEGQSWQGGPEAGQANFVAVRVHQNLIAAASQNALAVSLDAGNHWYSANLPAYITHIHDVALGPENTLWIAAHEGVFRSADNGDNWEHILSGLPAMRMNSITYDERGNRLFAASVSATAVYESSDGGRHWRPSGESGWQTRRAIFANGRLFVTTVYDGILAQVVAPPRAANLAGSAQAASQ